jgi:Ala-tRNA(Pro) deacylase
VRAGRTGRNIKKTAAFPEGVDPMSGLAPRLGQLFEREKVSYEIVRHPPGYTAQHVAAHTHTRGREFAKTVVLRADDRYVMAVLPAHRRVSLDRARETLGAGKVRLATEEELRRLFPDSEVGAEPPFGNLYDLPVYASPELAENERITFNGGSHEQCVRIRWADYERLVRPTLADWSG